MPSVDYSAQDLRDLIDSEGSVAERNAMLSQINVWLERGDGVAVYENHDLGHPELGHKIFLSYGSPAAQITMDTPPGPCPVDLGRLGGRMHWRYRLVGTYRGEPLSEFEEEPA
jgi:hypothetical protein